MAIYSIMLCFPFGLLLFEATEHGLLPSGPAILAMHQHDLIDLLLLRNRDAAPQTLVWPVTSGLP